MRNPNEHALVTRVPQATVDTVDALATACGLNRSAFTAYLIEAALAGLKNGTIPNNIAKDLHDPTARPAPKRLHRRRPLQIKPIVPPMEMAPVAAATPVIHDSVVSATPTVCSPYSEVT